MYTFLSLLHAAESMVVSRSTCLISGVADTVSDSDMKGLPRSLNTQTLWADIVCSPNLNFN